MNSKKKNKNRQNKPPNPTPPQKKEEVPESTSPIEEKVECAVEERVPNIVSENVPEVKDVPGDVKESQETPKKLKRNRGKKKKEDDKSDKEEENAVEEPVNVPEPQKIKDDEDETDIAPTARKKKNKNKKTQAPIHDQTPVQKEITCDVNVDEKKVSELEKTDMKPDQTETDAAEGKSSKKKNKKKKNRNDSERSDKEEMSCTSAFQKLLIEDESSQNKQIDTIAQSTAGATSESEEVLKDVEVISHTNKPSDIKSQAAPQKDEGQKNKKKNKKDKKEPFTDVPNTTESQKSPEITESTMNLQEIAKSCDIVEKPSQTSVQLDTQAVNIPSTSITEVESLKPKAQIVKPVEKKKKGKGNIEKTSEEKSEGTEIKVSESELLPVNEPTVSEPLPSVIFEEVVQNPVINPDWHEEVKSDEGNGPVVGCEEKLEVIAKDQRENSGQSKKRKKSPKPARRNETVTNSEPLVEIAPVVSNLDQFGSLQESSSLSQPTEVSVEIPRQEISENTQKQKIFQAEKVIPLKFAEDSEKIQARRKSPKPQKECDLPISETFTEVKQSHKDQSDELTNLTEKTENTYEKLREIEPNVTKDKTVEEDKTECHKTPHNEKKQKGKKSPKPPVDIDASNSKKTAEKAKRHAINLDDIIIIQAEVVSEEKKQMGDFMISGYEDQNMDVSKKIEDKSNIEKSKNKKKLPKPPKDESTSEYKPDSENIEVKEPHAEMGDFMISGYEDENKDVSKKLEDKSNIEKSKNKKKLPKPPKDESTSEYKPDSENIEVKEPHAEILTPVFLNPVIGFSPDVLPIETGTPKVELMPSPSDITPDFIEYPRCSSEQLSDTNNNTVIQEMEQLETKLEVPIAMPETPFIKNLDLVTPEVTDSSIKVNIEAIQKPSEDKTDLKSKVMEVNQDMEELRLSIEKSLAELTSLEKTDREAEDKMMEAENKSKTQGSGQDKPEDLAAKLPLLLVKSDDNTTDNKTAVMQPLTEETVGYEPICPERKDRKGKGKSKKKGKQEISQSSTSTSTSTTSDSKEPSHSQEKKKEDSNKSEQKSENTQEKGKQQANRINTGDNDDEINTKPCHEEKTPRNYEPIEHFEDAMTSSVDDVNKSFEIIANDANPLLNLSQNNPEINVIAPQEDDKESRQEKQNPISPPKNLLGHPDIPVPSSKTDYKKEKNKSPNYKQAKVNIKDSSQVQFELPEKSKQSKESQTENKRKFSNYKNTDESICVTNKNEDYIYKYSFRKVFLQCACHVCKKDLMQSRVPCAFCNLIFYCNQKHKDEDYAQHQALCFAVSTIINLKDQKFIYADARNITGHNYRLLRMQMIVSCEKVLKRRLAPWEQEALLYPRICADAGCREWRQEQLLDCEGCGQISYCSEHPEHLPKVHVRWCKSYNLYRALVRHQQTLGRLEPKLPTRVVALGPLPDNINEVLANMYEERIDMSDIEYAALTQLATAPLTALQCLYSHKTSKANGLTKKATLALHIVGAELQFEADVLNKWEVFLLHLVPDVKELLVVLVGPELNPSNLPLDLLGKIKLCENCQQNKRRVVFSFQDKRTYHEFWASDDFTAPDLVCAFNPSIQRSSTYNGKDTWRSTINCILKLKAPFAITSYTLSELNSDLLRIQECAGVGYSVVCAPKTNSFSSVRPDRNFISDDEAPLLFKNHCVTVVCGV